MTPSGEYARLMMPPLKPSHEEHGRLSLIANLGLRTGSGTAPPSMEKTSLEHLSMKVTTQ